MKVKSAYSIAGLAFFVCAMVLELIVVDKFFSNQKSLPLTAGFLAALLIAIVFMKQASAARSFRWTFAIEPPKLFEKKEIGGVPVHDAIQNIVDAKMADLAKKVADAQFEVLQVNLRTPDHADMQTVSDWMIALEAARRSEKQAREAYYDGVKSARVHGFKVGNEPDYYMPRVA